MEKAKFLFESYNMAVEESFEALLADKKQLKQFMNSSDHAIYDQYLRTAIEQWASTPVTDLGGKTPAEYINSMDELDHVLDCFKMGAVMCDEALPQALMNKLRSFGDRAVDTLLDLIKDPSVLEHEDGFLISAAAVKALGDWKVERAAVPLVKYLFVYKECDDFMMEEITGALTHIGIPALDELLSAVENEENLDFRHVYALSVIAQLGKDHKNDRIYRCLKNSFLNMENKVLGAIYLGEYGDGRAIPALRGFIEKNKERLDRETYYEIAGAVIKLGGVMDDLQIEFDEEE